MNKNSSKNNSAQNTTTTVRELSQAEIASVSGGDVKCGAIGGFMGYLLGAPIVCTDSNTGVSAAYYF